MLNYTHSKLSNSRIIKVLGLKLLENNLPTKQRNLGLYWVQVFPLMLEFVLLEVLKVFLRMLGSNMTDLLTRKMIRDTMTYWHMHSRHSVFVAIQECNIEF